MTTGLTSYKCPNCGAELPFDAHAQQLKCQYCGTTFDVGTLESLQAEENIQSDEFGWESYDNNEQINENGQITYVCPSCGGAVVGDESMAACPCPYCGNSVIVAKQFEGMLKPDLIVPFELSLEDARKSFAQYLSTKKLLASDFADTNVVEKLNGLYVPYWLFSCDSQCQARFNATRETVSHGREEDIIDIAHFVVYRDGRVKFDNVPVDASTKLSAELMESLEPFNYSKAVDFSPAYLSGFFADKFDDDPQKARDRANQRIKNSMINVVSNSVVGYTNVQMTGANVRFKNGIMKYALLPVYIFSVTYNGQPYTFAMNGQTGKFTGNLPADQKKSSSHFLLTFLIVFAVIFAVMTFLVK